MPVRPCKERVLSKNRMGMDIGLPLLVCISLPNPRATAVTKPYHPFFYSLPAAFTLKSKPKPNPQPPFKQRLCSRRTVQLSIFGVLLGGSLPAHGLMELERYTDFKEGFTMLRPSSYVRVDKAGATVLFEEFNQGSNNVGVVVNPVRLTTLADFGTPQFVANRLIQAEKRKESTRDAEVIGVAERSGHGGLKVYEFEYRVDSTRGGVKRIFSAAFVTSKKLYLLNIAHSDKSENPLDIHTRMLLEEVLHSFDASPTT